MPDKADALSGLAPLLRVRPELQALCRLGAAWAIDHAAEQGRWMPFHIVTRGSCAIDLIDLGQNIALTEGDVAVLPHATRHVVRSHAMPAGAKGSSNLTSRSVGAISVKSNTDSEPETELVCGRMRLEAGDNLVLSALPEAIVVATRDGPDAARLRQLMSTIKAELEDDRPAASVIATDLASALFVMVVRVHLDRGQADSGLLRLLADKQTARAVDAMLADPARDWTLDQLAERAHVSRASLVRLFKKIADVAPVEFLAELRLQLAMRKLCVGKTPLAEIAAEIGYQSESAFSRAFRRRFGKPPGDMRLDRG